MVQLRVNQGTMMTTKVARLEDSKMNTSTARIVATNLSSVLASKNFTSPRDLRINQPVANRAKMPRKIDLMAEETLEVEAGDIETIEVEEDMVLFLASPSFDMIQL